MKRILLLVLLSASGCMLSQTLRYYKPGQAFTSADNAGLLIKNDKRTLEQLGRLNNYSAFKTVKLSGFTDPEFDMDSLLALIPLAIQPETLIFENCDLSGLNQPLSVFTSLKELQLVKNSSFDSNTIFELLKGSPVNKIVMQTPEPSLPTDSLYLLENLTALQVSSNNTFIVPNRTTTYRFAGKDGARTIELAYFGDLYKEPKPATMRRTAPVKTSSRPVKNVPMACIKQPIPGININDTVYSFNAQAGTTVMYESGSRISIDKGAFVTQSGDNYKGKVQLFYREFRNPVEIMLSGIPMGSVVGGELKLFKSGGMYEINAFDAQGGQLRARSDTAIKIRFALTDTSASFKFYSLGDNGNWKTEEAAVVPVVPDKGQPRMDSGRFYTRAVAEYYKYLLTYERPKADTTSYEARFANTDYLYTYRKDNLEKRKDSLYYWGGPFSLGRCRGHFRIKYVRHTKDREIIYSLVPLKGYGLSDMPSHIRILVNRSYRYNGTLTKEEFRQTYVKKVICWDIRLNDDPGSLNMVIKTDKGFLNLNGTPASVADNGYCRVNERAVKTLGQNMKRSRARDAREFDKKKRYYTGNNNVVNYFEVHSRNKAAYLYSKKYQDATEQALSFEGWLVYVKSKYPSPDYVAPNTFQNNNQVGDALLKSGLGVKNIDTYIHSGQMEDVYVNYGHKDVDSLVEGYNAMLFKSINTSYPVQKSFSGNNTLTGYYFKNRDNYLVHFSKDGFMQVTKPEDLKASKKGKDINLAYNPTYDVKHLSSKEITKLILD